MGPPGVGGSLLVFFFFLRARILDEFPFTLEVHGPGAQAAAGPASLRLGPRLSPHLGLLSARWPCCRTMHPLRTGTLSCPVPSTSQPDLRMGTHVFNSKKLLNE